MAKEQTIRSFQKEFNEGKYDSPDVDTQIKAGWYDWFCKDSSLAKRTQKLGKIVCKLKDSKRVNLDTMYVFFKNNCPMVGPTYDSIKICDRESGDVIFNINFNDKREDKNITVWSDANDFQQPLMSFDRTQEVADFFCRQ